MTNLMVSRDFGTIMGNSSAYSHIKRVNHTAKILNGTPTAKSWRCVHIKTAKKTVNLLSITKAVNLRLSIIIAKEGCTVCANDGPTI